MASTQTLDGLTILLVEDESIVSMLAEDVLLNAGCTVLLAMRLQEGLELALSAAVDLGVLDVNLGGGETSYPIADLLAERQIPFVFATGYHADGFDQRYSQCVRLQKPYSPDALLKAASAVVTQQ
jgi:CheY-like chemotaxis protein